MSFSINKEDADDIPTGVRTSYLLVQAYFATRTRIETALKPLGLTGLQFTILSTLKNRNDMSSADLARRFYKTPQAMGQLLNVLVTRDLVERAEDPDNRRILRVSLTEEGRRVAAAGDLAMRRIEKSTFSGFEAETLRTLRTALHDLSRQGHGDA